MAGHFIRELDKHHLLGRAVVHLETGRHGTVALGLQYRSKDTDAVINTIAHMRPTMLPNEWTAKPRHPVRAASPAPRSYPMHALISARFVMTSWSCDVGARRRSGFPRRNSRSCARPW